LDNCHLYYTVFSELFTMTFPKGAFKCCRKGASAKSGKVPGEKKERKLLMKFNTETLTKITALLVADYERQLEGKRIPVEELEQGLRKVLQRIGQESLGRMLSMKDRQSYAIRQQCSCGEQARRISRRAARILSVFGWTEYRRSYYACVDCNRRWYALDEDEKLRAGRVSCGMNRLLGIAGVTGSFEEAQRQVQEYLLVDVSINTIRAETQRIGAMQS
jgi:hypothetical protein